jgi:nucleotide-binding universal stress UspA family protein
MNYAVEAAKRSNALLSGVFLDDFLYHSYPAFDMMESVGMRSADIGQLEQEDKDLREQSIAVFNSACGKAQIKYLIHHDKNFAIEEVLKESIYSDLLIVACSETFNHYNEEIPSSFIRRLLAGVQCPVMVVPNTYRETEKVVLLYDGKPSSVFAIKMYNYLMPWMRELKTEVISVRNPKDRAEFPNDPLIKEFMKCHYPDAKYTLLQGDPETEIPAYLKNNCQNTMIVLGAYERSQVSRWFKTSMADILMHELDSLFFIAH